MSIIGAVVLAAGTASRFGRPKQLESLWGRPLLEHALLTATVVEQRVVVLGAHANEILERVPLHGAMPVLCESRSRGTGASLAAGLEALEDAEAAVVLLGDQPLISKAAVARVIAARSPMFEAVRATYRGRPGHPVLLERRAFGEVTALDADEDAREALGRLSVCLVACDGVGSNVDVDTPSALERLAG